MRSVVKGIVIRSKAVGDDRLLTLLTEDFGVISALARGAGKPRSRLASSTELFCYCTFSLFRYRDSNTIDSAEPERSFFELRKDLTALSLASYFAELCRELCPQEQEAGEYLRLLLNTLHLLCRGKKSVWLLKPLFEFRLLTMAGFMPDLTGCAGCGEFKAPEGAWFDFESGDFLCESCYRRSDKQNGEEKSPEYLPPAVLAAMRHIIYSEFEKLFSFTLPEEALFRLNFISESYLKYHLQRGYRSLEFFYSVAEAAPARQ